MRSGVFKLSDARTCTKNAGLFRSAPAFLNLFMCTLKIISDYYPGRLHKAFVVDPPSLFSYLWKGVRSFVELSVVTAVVSSLDFEDSIEDAAFASCRTRAASLRFDPVVAATARLGGSTSSRFSFTVSHLDSLKPWYLSTTTRATPRAVMPTASPSLVGASPLSARSFSFASPAARSMPRASRNIPSTPCSFPPPTHPQQQQQPPRTPRPSFLQSPATLFTFWKEGQAAVSRGERERESFLPFLRFYRRPYDEMAYRAKMRPPLGGLISIISPHLKQQQLQQQQRRRNAINIHRQRPHTLTY
ncbi:SEC14 cytosolic factor family protein [Musa troglodytarum]|uniref:SEC14 cytosolic factor family protein n=1 Tax=Musa troglodytarum TaxID=320322 RepID=A0A9E7EAH2_9LILI|nr:SEC14 cytosolic factor family protein [Musa troglodytarum]